MERGDPQDATGKDKSRKRENKSKEVQGIQRKGDPIDKQLFNYSLQAVPVRKDTNSFFASIAKQTVDAITESPRELLDANRLRREMLQMFDVEVKLLVSLQKNQTIESAKEFLGGDNWDMMYEKLAVHAFHYMGIEVAVFADNLKPLCSPLRRGIDPSRDIIIIRHDAGHYSATEPSSDLYGQPPKIPRPWKTTVIRVAPAARVNNPVPIKIKADDTLGSALQQIPDGRSLEPGQGKGNSLFNCVVIQLQHAMTAATLRKKVCDVLRQQRQVFEELLRKIDDSADYDSLRDDLRVSGFYRSDAADLLIYAIQAVLEERIVILQDKSQPFVVGEDIPLTECSIYLIKNKILSGDHYDAAVSKTLEKFNSQQDEQGVKQTREKVPVIPRLQPKSKASAKRRTALGQIPGNRELHDLPGNYESTYFAVIMHLQVSMTTLNLRGQACDLLEREKNRFKSVVHEGNGSYEHQVDYLRHQGGYIYELMEPMIRMIQRVVQQKIVVLRNGEVPLEIGREQDSTDTIYLVQKSDLIGQYNAALVKKKEYPNCVQVFMEADEYHQTMHGKQNQAGTSPSPLPASSQQYEEEKISTDAQLKKLGRVEVNVSAIGNCMFEAVADQLENFTAAELRQTSCEKAALCPETDSVREFLPMSNQKYQELVKLMRKPNEWSNQLGDVMLEFIYRVINRPLVVIGPNRAAIKFPNTLSQIPDNAVVVVLRSCHYNSSKRVDADTTPAQTTSTNATTHAPAKSSDVITHMPSTSTDTTTHTPAKSSDVITHTPATSTDATTPAVIKSSAVVPLMPDNRKKPAPEATSLAADTRSVATVYGSAEGARTLELQQVTTAMNSHWGSVYEQLLCYGLIPVPTEKDGNSFFQSVAEVLITNNVDDEGFPFEAEDLREKVARKIEENRRYGVYVNAPPDWRQSAKFIRGPDAWDLDMEEYIVNIMYDIGLKVVIFSDNVPPVTHRFVKNYINMRGSIVLQRKGSHYAIPMPSVFQDWAETKG